MYIILFVIVFVAGVLFGNDSWPTSAAAAVTGIAVVSVLFLTVFPTTTFLAAIVAGLKLIITTLIAMFTGVSTGVLTKLLYSSK